jgi:hypothetical protein
VVKVPKPCWVKPSTHVKVTSYSPATSAVLLAEAASFMLTPKGVLNGPSWEIPDEIVDTSTRLSNLLGPFTVTM